MNEWDSHDILTTRRGVARSSSSMVRGTGGLWGVDMWFTFEDFRCPDRPLPTDPAQQGVYFAGIELYTRQTSKSSSAATAVAFALLLFDLAQLG